MAYACCFYVADNGPGTSDFQCPSCGAYLEIEEWHSEYGDAITGTHDVVCNCGHKFEVIVEDKFDIEVVKNG